MSSINSLKKTAMAVAIASVSLELNALALEEIIVTAQKRTESLQEVPIAVTAMNERTLQQAGITNITGIAQRTPGFTMGSYSAAQPLMYIRGVGTNERGAGGGESSVAMFLDGVYMNRAAGGSVELFDLAAVEVLRGPQGTLWGKNAVAGVVNLKSKRPSDTLEMSAEATVGNLGRWGVQGLISGPLGDNMAGKLTVSKKQRGAFMESAITSKADTGDLDAQSIRGQLQFNPADTIEGLLTVDYSRDERSGISVNPQLNPDAPLADAANFFANLQPEIDFHETLLEDPGHQNVEGSGVSLQLDFDIGDMTLTSITAYRKSESDLENNTVGTGLQAFPVFEISQFTDEKSDMFSQELRLAGGDDRLNWQAGLYYFSEETDRVEGGGFLIGPAAGLLNRALIPANGMTLTDMVDQHAEVESVAAFGEFTWSATERLDLTFGARYSRDEKDYGNIGTAGISMFVRESYDIKANETWSNPTYKFVANYDMNDAAMIYASAATGFKSGGWGSLSSTEIAAKTPFEEETALNLEIGVKSMLMDDRIRLNAALFSTHYEDLQVASALRDGVCVVCPTSTVNAGEAEIKGLELEFTWAVTEDLQLMANYAYLDTEYTKLDDFLKEHEGNTMRNAPKNAYNLVALYETMLPTGGELSARAEYIHKDDSEQEIANWSQSLKPEYDVVNFRLGYTSEGGEWEVAAWVKNAFDEEYLDHSYYQPGFGAVKLPALPRSYGVTVTWTSF